MVARGNGCLKNSGSAISISTTSRWRAASRRSRSTEVSAAECSSPFGRLTWLLDVLIQHARRIVCGLDDERVAFPAADGMAERAALAVLRMRLHVHVDDAPHVHPFVMQHDVRAVSHDFERRARRAPDAADRDRIAAERRVILERIVGRDGLLARRRQQLHHRLRTARAAVRVRREQPGAEDVLARRQRAPAARGPAGPLTLKVRPSANSMLSKKHM